MTSIGFIIIVLETTSELLAMEYRKLVPLVNENITNWSLSSKNQ